MLVRLLEKEGYENVWGEKTKYIWRPQKKRRRKRMSYWKVFNNFRHHRKNRYGHSYNHSFIRSFIHEGSLVCSFFYERGLIVWFICMLGTISGRWRRVRCWIWIKHARDESSHTCVVRWYLHYVEEVPTTATERGIVRETKAGKRY